MSLVCFVTQVRSTLRSSAPRARKGCPQASALRLCSPRCARPFHSRCASLQGWERPLPLQLLPPPSPGGVRHVHAAFQRGKCSSQNQGEATMTTTAPTTIDSKKPNTKQELIAANIKLLIEQLEAGKSDALTNYLTAMSRFHNYSFGNVLEIARQMPTATRVAGFWTWKNLGRSVNAGAKGIRILAPIVGVRRKKDEEAEKDITKQNTRVLLGFRNTYVFDISQTDGVDLPELREVKGDPGENIDRLAAFLKGQGIQLVYNEKIAPALGMSYGGRIAILSGQSKAEEFSTLVHEAAHEMLHKAERRTATTKTVRETEAEAVAFVVGKAVGLVTGNASADYIHLYHGNASLLAESLEVIQQTASIILAALEPAVEDTAAEPQTTEAEPELAEAA